MNASRQGSLGTVLLLAVVYLVVGLTFGALANSAASPHTRATWRLAAWVASAVAFGAHIGYELLRLRRSPRTTARHASTAVALGAFGLAVAANIHAFWVPAPNRRFLVVALVAWPLISGLPAFVLALAASTGLALVRRDR